MRAPSELLSAGCRALGLVVLAAIAAGAAEEPTPVHSPLPPQEDLVRALAETAQQYGKDAVSLEAYLVNAVQQAGPILDAEVRIDGFEDRNGKKFLAYQLSGIIFNDRTVEAEARPARLWSDVIERALRRLTSLTVPADGIAVHVPYHHKAYTDLFDLRDNLDQGRGEPENMAFYLLSDDVTLLLGNKISGQALVDRAGVLRNGAPHTLHLPAAPAETPTPGAEP